MRCSLGMYKAHSLNVQIRFINFGNQSIYPVLENWIIPGIIYV